ncbi:DUF1553 domain-containing protein [bacterium]|nr:DUF1553 domain-containing protein [bacterium]
MRTSLSLQRLLILQVWAFSLLLLLSPPALAEEPIPIRPIDPDQAGRVSYSLQIKPLLEAKCVGCHVGARPKGLYDVTSVHNLMQEGGSAGPGVIPGKPDDSSLVQYVRGILQPRMPKEEPPLSEDEVHLIREWIASGAIDDSSTQIETRATTAGAASAPPLSQEEAEAELQALLFTADPVEQLLKKRAYRLKYLPAPPQPPEVTGPVNNDIDRFIVAKWESSPNPAVKSNAPKVCDDPTFLRRVFLDVIGRIPSITETESFLNDSSPEKRQNLVDQLLARNSEYAGHWTPFWEDALCSNGNHQGGVGTHGNYRDWAFKNFEQNKPYDIMAAELIDPTMPNHPERYILNNEPMKTVQSAANTAQVFLGTGLKCASCHNHFENKEWTQARFFGFAGYFAPSDLELVRCEQPTGQFIPTRFIFDLPDMPNDVPANPTSRLRRVAQLLVDPTNPRFAKTIVNRLWKRHFGLGLFEPVDDFRLDRPPSHPELLDWLADDFMRHGFDIKHTIRLILNSRTYQLAYNPEFEDHYDVGKPDQPRYFQSPSLRRLTAEQVLDSLLLVAGRTEWRGKQRTFQDDESTPLTRSLGRPSARNDVSTSRPEDVAVVQALELLNGDELYERIYQGPAISQMASQGKPEQIVHEIYLRILNRPPGEDERSAGIAFLESCQIEGEPRNPQSLNEVIGDMVWAFVSSPGFQYIN